MTRDQEAPTMASGTENGTRRTSPAVPAVERAVAILDCLAAQPEPVSLAWLAREIGIHKGTCLSILRVLTENGYCERDETTKEYMLGSALIRLGHQSAERYEAYSPARREMAKLVHNLDADCLICVRERDEMVVLDRMGRNASTSLVGGVGQRVPLRPPLGSVFYAWADDQAITRWLASAPSEEHSAVRAALTAIRARGYSIGGRDELKLQVDVAIARLAEASDQEERQAAALDLAALVHRTDQAGSQISGELSYIIGPVFDSTGQVALTLTLLYPQGSLTGDAAAHAIEKLMAAAQRVTKRIGGHLPTTSLAR